MKFLTAASLLSFALIHAASAITDADLTPEALAGKTVTFTIESGAAPLAASGTWTGTFGNPPGKAFTITNVAGAATNSTWTYDPENPLGNAYIIAPFISGQGPTSIALWISDGAGPRFYVDLDGKSTTVQYGSFSISAANIKAPEISVTGPTGKPLGDNAGKVRFGSLKKGQTGPEKTFTIKNTGKAKLTGITINKNIKDFIITGPTATSLAPNKSVDFKVSFKPSSAGVKNAVIKINSNDADESPFEITITGVGTDK